MKSGRRSEWISTQRQHEWTTSASMPPLLLLLLLLVGLSLVAQPAQADCSECCSPRADCSHAFQSADGVCCSVINDHSFCCPKETTCVTNSSSGGFDCLANGQSGNEGATEVSRVRGDVTYVRPICGFGCIMAISLAFWLCLPACIFLCWPGTFQRPLSWEEQAAAEAAARGWRGPVLVYPPPTSYAVYSDRQLSWQPELSPRARDRRRSPPPDAGSAPKLWEGPARRMDEEEQKERVRAGQRQLQQGEPMAGPMGSSDPSSSGVGGGSSQPTMARSPPPRDRPDPVSAARPPPPTATQHSHSWHSDPAAERKAAEAAGVISPPAHAAPPTSAVV